jgi:betaine-aldehyde dehydrogenase
MSTTVISSSLPAVHWIGGEWVDAGQHHDSIDPATGEVIGQYAEAGPAEAEQAIAAAKRAFQTTDWKHDRALRARVLNNMAGRFEAHHDELVELLGRDNGKIRPHAELELQTVGQTLRFNAALALTEAGRAAEIEAGSLSMVIRQPTGVAGVIAPSNSPVALVLRSLAPALAAGATAAVMLPTPTAQVNALINQIISETPELPIGVVNIITGGPAAGDVLVRSPDVPVISFTGSSNTGRTISANAAPGLKRLGLELGGKTPMIVFDDADLTEALPMIVTALVVFAGQFCMTGSRVLVQCGIAEQVREELTRRLGSVTVGPASDPTSEMGPVIDRANAERVDRMVEEAIDAGAEVLLRGGLFTVGPLSEGAFLAPTLLEVRDSSLPIVQKEVFGPVLTLQVFDTEAEAVALANDSEYGLSASVWSRDIDRPLRVAHELDSGTVWINGWATLYDQFEEGGFKASGQGRMRGLAVMDDFLEYKHISLKPGTIKEPQS